MFIQSISRDLALAHLRTRTPIRDRDLALARDRTLGFAFAFDLGSARVRDLDLDLDRALALALALTLARDFNRDLTLDLENALSLARSRASAHESGRDFARDRPLRIPMLGECLYSSLLQEAFRPELSSSWPPFGCNSLSGRIGDATLTGPDLVEFEVGGDGRTICFADPQGRRPGPLIGRGYDLTFPMPAIPLGSLRRGCASWRTDRRYPPLGVLPFLFPSLHSLWPEHAMLLRRIFRVSRIFTLLPRLDLWGTRFADWTESDWSTCGLSALWDLDTGLVLWAHGAHDVADMPAKGLPAQEFFGDVLKKEFE